jgi:hypothetical protein
MDEEAHSSGKSQYYRTKLVFSGKKIHFPVWEEKFLAKSQKKRILQNASGKHYNSQRIRHHQRKTTVQGKKEKINRKANDDCFEDLLLGIDGEKKSGRVAFQIVRSSKTTNNPSGHCSLAWTKLHNKFVAKTAPSLLKLKKKFATSKLKKKESDPDEWITDLEDIRTRMVDMGSTMSESTS